MINELILSLVEEADLVRASDIHFVLQGEEMAVQFRIGSQMAPGPGISLEDYGQLLSYIRFHASLSLSRPKQPQSGLLLLKKDGGETACRVSILPTAKYPSLVLRLINPQNQKELDSIPVFSENADLLKDLAVSPAGLVLVSGPTGSGKTTTAYALIHYLKMMGKSIVTIEDPVEYQQPDIVQMSVCEETGMTYDAGIREILRHDPDVIVIGEIRDPQTAHQAVRAALTGHLVISTIHAKNSIGTLHRLLDLGLGAQELEQAVIGVVNQRLVKVAGEPKALFEICSGFHLEQLFTGLLAGKIPLPAYKTLEEEHEAWKNMAG